MTKLSRSISLYSASVAALGILLLLYFYSQPAKISQDEESFLAKKFQFSKTILPVPARQNYKYIRQVNPYLKRVAAWISTLGAAVTLGDIDGDGLPNDYVLVDPRSDLVTVGPVPGSGNRYPIFTLNPAPLPYNNSSMAPAGCLVADLNEDGRMDFLVYYWGRTPVAFLQKENSNETAKIPKPESYLPSEISPSPELWYTGSANLADLDGDGHIDLIVGNYLPDGSQILNPQSQEKVFLQDSNSRAFNGGRKHIFLWKNASAGNTPSVQFEEQTNVLDNKISGGWTLAQGSHDLTGDLLPEIYFANDLGPDHLLLNSSKKGKLNFSELKGKGNITTPGSFILGTDSFKSMGVDFEDINGDGNTDIYVSNIASPFGLDECHFLWLNTGDLSGIKNGAAPFVQASESFGLSRGGWGWDCRLADFDNDSIPEAVQAKGYIKGKINRWPEIQALGTMNSEMLRDPKNWPAFRLGDDVSGHEPTSFFVRADNGKYYDLAEQLGLGGITLSRGISIADVDGDGRLDFAIANQWGDSYFLHNESPSQNTFLGLRLFLPANIADAKNIQIKPGNTPFALPCRPAIGAQATIHLPNGKTLSKEIDGGSGHSGKRSQDLHFGLNQISAKQKLVVDLRWRSAKGNIQSTSISLLPGWHNILLGSSKEEN